MSDEEEQKKPFEDADGDGKEVLGQELIGVGFQKHFPGGGRGAGPIGHVSADSGGGCLETELKRLARNPVLAPEGFSFEIRRMSAISFRGIFGRPGLPERQRRHRCRRARFQLRAVAGGVKWPAVTIPGYEGTDPVKPGSPPMPGQPPGGGLGTLPGSTIEIKPFETTGIDGEAPAGPIIGVFSTSTKESLRAYNGRRHYCEWEFSPMVGTPGAVPPPPPPGGQVPEGETGKRP
jgi:hypothetical protein